MIVCLSTAKVNDISETIEELIREQVDGSPPPSVSILPLNCDRMSRPWDLLRDITVG